MILLAALSDAFSSGLGRRALAEVVLLGALGGALSFWVTSFRLPYAAESLAHGLLPGAVLAALIGVPLAAGAGAGVVVAALLVAAVARDERVGVEAATAVAVTGLLGLGALLALAPESPGRLEELLFGDLLGLTDGDLATALAALAVTATGLVVLHRPLTAVAFDPDGAATTGVRAGGVTAALLVLISLALAVTVRGLGNLLALAVLVAPAVAVRGHTRTPAGAALAGTAVAVAAGAIGILLSFTLGLATGASVALALCAAAVLGSALPALRPPRARAEAAAPAG
jgi:ABC-type Mn2+/Zn2+ transport system permease subunit